MVVGDGIVWCVGSARRSWWAVRYVVAREREEVNALGGTDMVRFAADGDEIRECKRRC